MIETSFYFESSLAKVVFFFIFNEKLYIEIYLSPFDVFLPLHTMG